ncbi:MAG TPA: PEP-CTERM sorting domain-containing protein [Burkholderiales bacterium]|nr:PEP-CTERM sorting domain-containing protein [Burkholderiales bacterium]
MFAICRYASALVAALVCGVPAARSAEAWIQTPRVENRQINLTPTAWAVTSRYTGGAYNDDYGVLRTADVQLGNTALFRTGGAGAGLWDITWSITNLGTGELTRFASSAGGPPFFLHDPLSPGETQNETATLAGPIFLAQWEGQWGAALTAGVSAVYFHAAAVPEPGTMALLGCALLTFAGGARYAARAAV